MIFLAVCHTIIIDEKKGTFNAASPDELALVHFAKQFGYTFTGVDSASYINIHDSIKGKAIRFKLLHTCEFTSSRKRMSVILECENGEILLMCKGADSVIEARLSHDSLNGQTMRCT